MITKCRWAPSKLSMLFGQTLKRTCTNSRAVANRALSSITPRTRITCWSRFPSVSFNLCWEFSKTTSTSLIRTQTLSWSNSLVLTSEGGRALKTPNASAWRSKQLPTSWLWTIFSRTSMSGSGLISRAPQDRERDLKKIKSLNQKGVTWELRSSVTISESTLANLTSKNVTSQTCPC